ncbi:murein hydrolase activator EnvC family protein [Neobacillus thermocopriae]|uniref:murein hydrolase activator EnvC family protein n=1 Tax=Neobacillus thermocopriae TaxID=1215031 RepID=UPI002E1CA221|nr:peptidoglycan DD-metalloendopeptidase family protein [Neobacillus thermocopriae]MED3714669.1 peptidoglycan DD-metalloendopeptidase family protein [Neobacillus thermocopriae]
MKKQAISLAVAATVGMGTVIGGFAIQTEAASISSLKEQQNKIQSQRSDVHSNIKESTEKLSEIKNQQTNVKNEIQSLDKEISETTKQIEEKTAKIATTKDEITKLQAKIEELKDRIEKRNILLKERVRSYQENGLGINYLDVLLGSTSFSDFIERASAVATFMQADQDILKQHEADKNELEATQLQVKKELASLEKMVAELESMKKQLNAKRAEKDQLMAQLVQQEEEEHSHMMDLKEQEKLLAIQEAAIQKAIKQEQERQAKAAAAAAAAKSRTTQSSTIASSGNAPKVSSGGGSGSAPNVSSGVWTQPATGYVSSGFGYRSAGRHDGVDIANGASVPILAAADGVVIRAYYSTTYGNCIFLSHSINGQVYTTVYAHMSSLAVGSGATVKKGQKIGTMGNTGRSRGQHLHFELHKGPWTPDKRNAINPVGIVPLP